MKTETPTAEQILEKHSPIFNPLFADSNVRKWKANVVTAMEEYASIKTKALEEALDAYKDYANFLQEYEQRIAVFLDVHRMGPSRETIKEGEDHRSRISKAVEALEKHTPPVGVETK